MNETAPGMIFALGVLGLYVFRAPPQLIFAMGVAATPFVALWIAHDIRVMRDCLKKLRSQS